MSVRIDACTALIVAGGESRRMGRDKATLPFSGRPLVDDLALRLQPAFSDLLVSVRLPRADIRWPQVCDHPELRGPLAGLEAGLSVCTTPWLFAIAVDMPFLELESIARLAALRGNQDAVVPFSEGEIQPLAAFYSVSATRKAIADLLAQADGRRSLRAVLERLQVCRVDAASLLARPLAFADLDTPEDVRKYRLGLGEHAKADDTGLPEKDINPFRSES